MKIKISTAIGALLTAMMVLSCDLEPTRPDLKPLKDRYAPERTSVLAFNTNTVTINLMSVLPGSLTTVTDTYTLNFNQGSGINELKGTALSLDLLKLVDKDAFETQLKKTVIFSSFGSGGDATKLEPAARTTVAYSVVEWKDYQAKIKFTGLASSLSNPLEVRIDPAELTHHDGIRFDVNNDGIFDEYDTVITSVALAGGTTYTGTQYYYQRGLLTGTASLPTFSYTSWPSDAAAPKLTATFSNIQNFDTTNYAQGANDLNEYFKLQKFTKEKGWENTGIKATYTPPSPTETITGAKEFVFTITGAVSGDVYRVKFENYQNAVKNFKSGVAYNGIAQKLFGSWNASIAGNTSSTFRVWKTGDTAPTEIDYSDFGDIFSLGAITFDSYSRNGSFILGINLAETGDKGLPDPNDYISKGIIKMGYTPDDRGSGTWTASYWNEIVFFPNDKIKVETYRNDGEAVAANKPADRWRIILPSEYKKESGYRQHYFFINGDYKTLGDSTGTPAVRQFGNTANTGLVLKEGTEIRSFYRVYPITNSF